MRKIFAALFALILMLPAVSCASTSVGNGASCSFYPESSQGNGYCSTQIGWYTTKAWPSYFDSNFYTTTNAFGSQMEGARNTSIVFPDPYVSNTGFACWGEVVSGSMQPFAVGINFQTGGFGTPHQINSNGTSSNNHNEPGCGSLGRNYGVIFSGGYYTGANAAPCLSVSGASGTTYKCQYVNVGDAVTGSGSANYDLVNAGSMHAVPIQQISEVSSQYWNGVTLSCGQGQPNSGFGFTGTSMACLTLYATFSAAGALSGLTADTATPGGAISAYDVLNGTIANASNGAMVPILAEHDDVVAMVKVTADAAQSAASLTLSLPAAGSWAGGNCTISLASTGTTATDVSTMASDFNAASCNTAYSFSQVANASGDCPTANTCMDVKRKTGDPTALATPALGTNSTGLTASLVDEHTATAGSYHNGFEYGFVKVINGTWFLVMENLNTAGDASGAVGVGTYAKNATIIAACKTPVGGVWTWGIPSLTCGAAEGATFTASPSTIGTAVANFRDGGGAGYSCSPTDCSGTINEYENDTTAVSVPWLVKNATTANKASGIPAYSFDNSAANQIASATNAPGNSVGMDIGINKVDGDLDFVHNCGYTNGILQLCLDRINRSTCTANGCPTDTQTYIESGITNANGQANTIRVAEEANGYIVVLAAIADGGVYPGCTSQTGTCIVQYVYSHDGASQISKTVEAQLGGSNGSATCLATLDEFLRHLDTLCMKGGSDTTLTASDFYY